MRRNFMTIHFWERVLVVLSGVMINSWGIHKYLPISQLIFVPGVKHQIPAKAANGLNHLISNFYPFTARSKGLNTVI